MQKIGDFVGFADLPAERTGMKWHIVQVKAGRESTTGEYLKKHRFEVYNPMVRTMRLIKRRDQSRAQRAQEIKLMRPAIVALFPGYSFLRFDIENDPWHELFDLKGVRGLVLSNNLPRVFPDKDVALLRKSEVDGALPGSLMLSQIPFLVGENVRVAAGPFAGFPAVIEELPKAQAGGKAMLTLDDLDESMRVKLAVCIFGRDTPVSLPITDIEKA
jgi:transcription antitermination factor NusG